MRCRFISDVKTRYLHLFEHVVLPTKPMFTPCRDGAGEPYRFETNGIINGCGPVGKTRSMFDRAYVGWIHPYMNNNTVTMRTRKIRALNKRTQKFGQK